jgi:hypothetical protein
MAAINIQSLFADIIDTPEQRQQKLLQQGMLQGQLLSSGLRGRAAALAPLAQIGGQLGVQRNDALRRAVQPMIGIDPRSTGERVSEQLQGLDPENPDSLLQVAQALQSTDPVRAASLRQMAAQKRVEKTQLDRQQQLQDIQIKGETLNFEQAQREAQAYINNTSLRQRSLEAQVESAELANKEAARKLNNPDDDSLFERDTVTFGNGLSILTDSKGNKIVKDLNGNVLLGDDAVKAVAEARQQSIQDEAAKSSARQSGSQYAKIAVDSLNTAEVLTKQVANLNNAISLLDEGAKVGGLDSLLAPFDAATAALQTQQRELGLGVISSVTFGALSQGELDLALSINAPVTNDEAELRKWYEKKSAATLKLAQAAKDQAIYFSRPGASIEGWYALQDSVRAEREFAEANNTPVTDGDPNRAKALESLGITRQESDTVSGRRRRNPR